MNGNFPPVVIIKSNRSNKNEVKSVMQAGECMFHVKSHFCGPHQYRDQLLAILKRNLGSVQ